VLKEGNHAEISKWRRAQSLERTKARRPDLLPGASGAGDARSAPKDEP
jgi:tRNA (guanine37-N1)-methyltransferase